MTLAAEDDRLARFGVSTYREYLRTPHWKRVRTAYWASGLEVECAVCGTGQEVELHHKSYRNLGRETPADLVPLCRTHHGALHRLRRSPTGERLPTVRLVRELRRRYALEFGHGR